MKKRVLAMLLAVIMTAVLTGCNSNKDTAMEATQKDSDEEEVTEGDTEYLAANTKGMPKLPNNTLSVSVSVPTFGTAPKGTRIQEEWQTKMEEYLGCTLDITWTYTPWLDYRDNENVILASGNIPDVFTYSQRDIINGYGDDGQVLDIAKYKDYITYYNDFVNETPGGESMYNADGTAYYFKDGFVNEENIVGAQSFTGFIYRFDILQENNLTPATTLQEFTELCAMLKEMYPDAYVMSNTDKNYAFYRGFVGIFHTWDTLYWNGTEWAFGPIEDNFKEMLVYLRDLYDAGYIDPEFATDNEDACTQKATTGKVLIFPTTWAGKVNNWNIIKEKDEINFGLAYLPEAEGYGTPWKWGSKEAGLSLANNGFGVGISADVEYPEWIVKMIDYQYSPEMIELQNWGIEGVTYVTNADGTKSFTDEITSNQDPAQVLANYGVSSSAACRTGIVFTPQDFLSQIVQLNNEPWWSKEDGYTEYQYWLASSKYGGEDSICPMDMAPVVSLTADESTQRATLLTTCEKVAKEKALEFITGKADIETDWDAYVDAIKYAVDDFEGTMEMLNNNTVVD